MSHPAQQSVTEPAAIAIARDQPLHSLPKVDASHIQQMSSTKPHRAAGAKTNQTIDLSNEAVIIYPYISYCYNEVEESRMQPWDEVGVFLLVYCAQRMPRCWIAATLDVDVCNVDSSCKGRTIGSIPGLVQHIGADYIKRRLKKATPVEDIAIMDIFRCVRFTSTKGDITRSIYHWSTGNRPYVLLHHIPTPMEVLAMQAKGMRVITMLVTLEELQGTHISLLYYMTDSRVSSNSGRGSGSGTSIGPVQEHERDAFAFLLHDMEHMSNFYNDVSYNEQVGFFHQIIKINNNNLKGYFQNICKYDKLFLKEIEYVISDMNCTLPHLLYYLMAKMVLASQRKCRLNSDINTDSSSNSNSNSNNINSSSSSSTDSNSNSSSNSNTDSDTITITDSNNNNNNNNNNSNSNSNNNSVNINISAMDSFFLETGKNDFESNWQQLMHELELWEDPRVLAVALEMMKIVDRERGKLTKEEGEVLRDFFKVKSFTVVGAVKRY